MDTENDMLTDINDRNGDSCDNYEKKNNAPDGESPNLQRMSVNEALWQLRENHESKKELVQESMHKAMSPISAISGYLELIRMYLEKDSCSEQIEKYRSKIAEGMSELEEIVEDLYDTFDSENDEVEVEIKRTG